MRGQGHQEVGRNPARSALPCHGAALALCRCVRPAFLALLLAGCTVGVGGIGGPPPGGDDGTGGGGGGDVGPDAGADSPDGSSVSNPDAAVFACRSKVDNTTLSNGHHNAGQDCMNGCHNHGFTLAGTLYTTAAGGTPVKGGSITIVDANGQTFDVVSQLNGNFYTIKPVAFPVHVTASMCPDVKPMAGTIAAGSGGCNKNGCHVAGGQGRIHIP